ncbi:hypothetical protein [Phycicoccus flavus]|uniref:hypothetical protein n=1 Tax=Phycicoccus flavus TaxID=2502783 RepID=UPI000FEBD424|nr:hypothetical protein [Phycicoccus flavus]NHA68992.1 hypothetical protein [Phycicoccus flavus]
MRWVLRVLTVLVVVPLVLYVGHGLVRTVQIGQARDDARAELVAALPAARDTATEVTGRVVGALEVGPPRHRWQELTCTDDSIDAGWVVQDYEQVCVVHAYALVPVTDGPAAGCTGEGTPVDIDPARGWVSVHRGTADGLTAEDPWKGGCPRVVDSPGRPGWTRVLDGERPSTLDASSHWVLVTTEVGATRTRVGCSAWGVVFCGEPAGGPDLAAGPASP